MMVILSYYHKYYQWWTFYDGKNDGLCSDLYYHHKIELNLSSMAEIQRFKHQQLGFLAIVYLAVYKYIGMYRHVYIYMYIYISMYLSI